MNTDNFLSELASQADSLLTKAKKLREEMNALPPNDPQREVYETAIRELLESSRNLSEAVTARAKRR